SGRGPRARRRCGRPTAPGWLARCRRASRRSRPSTAQLRSWCEAYSGKDGRHPVTGEDPPAGVALQEPYQRMRAGHDDGVRIGPGDHPRPAAGQVAHLEVFTEDPGSVDLDPAVDKDPAAARVEPPDQ